MDKPAATERDEFLDRVRTMVEYWDGALSSAPPDEQSRRERLEGLAHSILAAMDEAPLTLVGNQELQSVLSEEYLARADLSGDLNDLLFGRGIWAGHQ